MSYPLPETVFDQHIIVLGKTRSGKSSVMRGMVEKLLRQNKPVCIVDPKGDWWGIKSSADGKEAGFDVVIFGGEHADVPINGRAGAAIAEIAATENRPCLVDLGGWMPSERSQFWIDFASAFFFKTKGRRWLVIDEVHNFCPKGKLLGGTAPQMLHWSNRLASEGLGKGVALIAASQRPQKVHNDFLTSCETLISMRVVHKADRAATEDWIDGCGDAEKGPEVVDSLAQLKRGEAWVWSPESEFGPVRIQFPMFSTYDSFKPQPVNAAKLKGWADVNLEEVKSKLQSVVKEAEANDPEKLKERIRELEAEARKINKTAHAVNNSGQVEKVIATVHADRKRLAVYGGSLVRALQELAVAAANQFGTAIGDVPTIDIPIGENPKKGSGVVVSAMAPRHAANPIPRSDSNGAVKGSSGRILTALVEIEAVTHKNDASREQLGFWSRLKPTTGNFKNYLGRLRAEGLVEYPRDGFVAITEAGRALVGHRAPPSQADVLQRARSLLKGPQQRILDALWEHGQLSREQLGSAVGLSHTTGNFKNYVGAMRTTGIVEYPRDGFVKLADWVTI